MPAASAFLASFLALLALALAARTVRRRVHRRWLVLTLSTLLVVLALPALVSAALFGWLALRRPPSEISEPWYEGVTYRRMVPRRDPPIVAHLVRIDLDAPGIDIVVTPPSPSPRGEVLADTTSGFAARHGVQLAINAHFFFPFRKDHPLSYEPHRGDPVRVIGPAASRGQAYGSARDETRVVTLDISRERRVSFGPPRAPLFDAVSGLGYVVQHGRAETIARAGLSHTLEPRTLIGVDQGGRTLLLLIIDGRQPGYSEGATLREAAELFATLGAHTAIQLDGGGSSTLVRERSGALEQVNWPVNFRIPGWEREIATQLGVRARPLP